MCWLFLLFFTGLLAVFALIHDVICDVARATAVQLGTSLSACILKNISGKISPHFIVVFVTRIFLMIHLYSDGIEIKKSYTNRYFRYYNALEEGRRSHHLAESSNNFSHKEKDVCHKLFGTCSNDMQDIINLDVLRIMQYLTRKFRIQFADTSMSETNV